MNQFSLGCSEAVFPAAKVDLEVTPDPPASILDDRGAPLCLVYEVLGRKPGVGGLSMLCECSVY